MEKLSFPAHFCAEKHRYHIGKTNGGVAKRLRR
jgi:hypothetical protein